MNTETIVLPRAVAQETAIALRDRAHTLRMEIVSSPVTVVRAIARMQLDRVETALAVFNEVLMENQS